VQRAHALEDGGGRELAYVKMSRARERSTVYVVADDVEQAREDLVREWSTERRPSWVIDSATPLTEPAPVEASLRVARPMRNALRRGRLAAERAAIAAVIPPDPTAEIETTQRQLARLQGQRRALDTGQGSYRDGPVGHAVWELGQAEMHVARLQRQLDRSDATRKDRRRWRNELIAAQAHRTALAQELAALSAPEVGRIEAQEKRLSGRLPGLQRQAGEHDRWVDQHPEAARRLSQLDYEIDALDERLQRARGAERAVGVGRDGPWHRPPAVQERDFGIDL
jgi:hypothetical protein